MNRNHARSIVQIIVENTHPPSEDICIDTEDPWFVAWRKLCELAGYKIDPAMNVYLDHIGVSADASDEEWNEGLIKWRTYVWRDCEQAEE